MAAADMSENCPSRTHPTRGIVDWNTIYTQLALDALPGRPADDELAGLMPAIFEHVDALGIYTPSTATGAPRAPVATRRVSFH